MARPRQRHGFHALAGRLALGRPGAHPPGPVLVVAVAHDERERRAERAALTEAREHLDLVRLDLLARRAPVAGLPAAQVRVDRLAVEHEARGQSRQDGDEGRAVRLAGGRELEGHAGKPSALRSTATGAGTPVQSSNDAAPCAASTSSPSSTRAPAASAASAVAVRGYGRSTSVCPSCNSNSTSSRTGVAWTTRSASPTSGGHSPCREKTLACGSAWRKAAAAPPSPTIAGRSRLDTSSRIAASVEKPSRPTRVFTDGRSLPTIRAAACLCGDVTFAPANPAATSPRIASSSRSGGTSSATYAQSSPRAANAAFCIAGESERATGCPSSATSRVEAPITCIRTGARDSGSPGSSR